MTEVAIVLFEGCQPSAISTLAEAFNIANLHSAPAAPPSFSWRTVSWDGRPVRGMGGVTLVPDGSVNELGKPDVIVAPAVRADDPGIMADLLRAYAKQWGPVLRDHHRRGAYLAANCSAVFLLAELGLLDGRRATTSWFLARAFRERFARVKLDREQLVIRDGRIFTSAAFSACLNLALEIIAKFVGPRAVVSCARVMLVDVNRTTQLSFADVQKHTAHRDDMVLRAQGILVANFARTPTLESVAKRLHVTVRTLNRRFKKATGETPIEFLQNARVERAKLLLESSRLTVDVIAGRVGYEDTGSFRRVFGAITGISPRDYRARFAVRAK